MKPITLILNAGIRLKPSRISPINTAEHLRIGGAEDHILPDSDHFQDRNLVRTGLKEAARGLTAKCGTLYDEDIMY